MSFTKNRIADTLHKTVVTVLLGVSVVGLIDIGTMHRSIMSAGKEAAATKELEDLRNLRDTATETTTSPSIASQTMPFPQGTDLHDSQARR